MNNTMHTLLNKLRIIGKIRAGQRLDTTNELTVYEEGWASWIYRKWYRDNKDETIRVLQELYKSIEQHTEQLISSVTNSSPSYAKKIRVVINLAKQLYLSIEGLDNLAKTYSNYPKVVASIEGIIQDYAVASFALLIAAIPEDSLLPILRRDINFNGSVCYDNPHKQQDVKFE